MGDRVKRWFRKKSREKSKDPYARDKRSRSSPGSTEAHSKSVIPQRSDLHLASQGHVSRSRSRTPNGSLHNYYLEVDPDPYPNMPSGLRSRSEPRFRVSNMDSKLRARDHGYYIRSAGIDGRESNKENVRLIYDRSRMTSPNRSGYVTAHTSRYVSKSGSRNESTSSSFRENRPRLYRPHKRPAPNPPAAVYSRQNSHDSHGSNGDVAMKVIRKKKRAPPPPPLQRTWSEQNAVIDSPRQSVVQTDVYPIEPPIDYDKEEIKTKPSEDEEEKVVPFIPPPPLPPPIGSISASRPDSPEPPPVPPKTDSAEETKGQPVARINTLLRKDIVKAAKMRAKKGHVEPGESAFRDSFMKFANELAQAVDARNNRRGFGTLRMRHISRSKMFKARPSKADITPPLSPTVDAMIERAQEQALLRHSNSEERRLLRNSARVETHEWTPEQDLDEVFETKPTEEITARGSDYYEVDALIAGNPDIGKTDSVLYKKAKYAKPNRRSKRSNLEKLKRSIGKAFGSIGRGLHKKESELEDLYREEDGWQIQYSKKVDAPPPGPISVKCIEKYPAYAYHQAKGQLVLLPDYDKIIVTEDGKRIREADLAKLNKAMPVLAQTKQRPALEGIFDTGGVTAIVHNVETEPEIEHERKDIELMEAQFEQVRRINKAETGHVLNGGIDKPWRSTPDLTGDLYQNGYYRNEGVMSDNESPLLTSSIRDDDAMRGKKKKRSLKKSKSKKTSSSSDSKSPRQKVLRKGLDYYLKQRPTTPNPVFSSDDEDEGVVQSDPNSDSSATKPAKADSLGDSGIGQESLNSSGSTSSMPHHSPPIPASFMQAGVDAKGQPLYYASTSQPVASPPVATHPVATHPIVITPSYHVPNPFMYQTMYYPTHVQPAMAVHQPMVAANNPVAMQVQQVATTTPPIVTPQPVDFQNQSRLSTDSTSTLVASELTTTTLNESKSSSKVINVSDNIALVSYNESKDTNPSPTTPSNTNDLDFQDQLRKQYLMGPVGYRPVKFDPSVKRKPVTLPERTISFNSDQTRPVPYPFGDRRSQSSKELLPGSEMLDSDLQLLNGPKTITSDKVLLNSPVEPMNTVPMDDTLATTQVLNNKLPSALSSLPKHGTSSVITKVTGIDLTEALVDTDQGENENAGHHTDQDDSEHTTGEPSSLNLQQSIPAEVLEKYGHENLVAL